PQETGLARGPVPYGRGARTGARPSVVVLVGVRVGLGGVHGAVGVLGRRVYRVDLQRGITNVGDVMPLARGYEHHPVVIDDLLELQGVRCRAHLDASPPLL